MLFRSPLAQRADHRGELVGASANAEGDAHNSDSEAERRMASRNRTGAHAGLDLDLIATEQRLAPSGLVARLVALLRLDNLAWCSHAISMCRDP